MRVIAWKPGVAGVFGRLARSDFSLAARSPTAVPNCNLLVVHCASSDRFQVGSQSFDLDPSPIRNQILIEGTTSGARVYPTSEISLVQAQRVVFRGRLFTLGCEG